jgi:Phage tail lysozyme
MATPVVKPGGGSGGGYVPPTTGPVTAREIYALLLQNGFSTVQAVGIMANMIAESNLNPEAVGDGSYGLVQFQQGSDPGGKNASSFVTGNAQADARAQIKYIAQVASKQSVSGSTGAQVAGNFAAYFERCSTCSAGNTGANGWSTRRGYAALVEKWISSGNWPTSAGSGQVGSGAGSGLTGTVSNPATSAGSCTGGSACCLVGWSGIDLKITTLGSFCLFTKTEARAIIGACLMGTGGGIMFVGLAVLTVSAFSHTKVGQAAGKAVGTAGEVAGAGLVIAGMPEAGAAVHAASRGPRSAARHVQGRSRQRQQVQARVRREQEAQNRHDERQYDEVMSRKRDSAKGPAIRDYEPVPF